jgi:hypothetical protein
MKKLLLTACMFTTAIFVDAQVSQSTSFNIGLDAATPIGVVSTNLFSFVFGASVQAEFPVAKDMSLTGTSGYEKWQAQKNLISISFIPVLGGVKYYFSPKVYGSGQVGVSIGTSKNGGNPFTYIPGIGFILGKNLDLLFKSTGLALKGGVYINNVGVRLGYHFRK